MSSKRSWYLVYTKSRQENLARENLERQGFVTYLPLAEQTRRCNGRYITTIEAFFPRYLFIHLDSETDNWAPIRSTIGVVNMVNFGGLPAVVPELLIESIQMNADENGIQKVKEKEMRPGDSVTIIEGSLIGYKGIYQQRKSKDRVTILLDLVGKHTEIILSKYDLLSAGNQ